MLKRGYIVPGACIGLAVVTFVYVLAFTLHFKEQIADLKADETMQELTRENTKALNRLAAANEKLAKAFGGK